MAQANVAREPSMDEILASIRRIIESNDPPQAGAAAFPSDEEEDDGPLRDENTHEIRLTIEDEQPARPAAFRSAPQDHIPSFPMQDRFRNEEPAQSEPPLSLADVAARVRAASERHTFVRETETKQPSASAKTVTGEPVTHEPVTHEPVTHEPVTREPVTGQNDGSPTVAARMGLSTLAAKPVAAANAEPFPKPAVVTAPPEKAAETAASEKRPGLVAQAAPVENAQAPVPPADALPRQSVATIVENEVVSLVSPIVGRKVARSFEDLALAVNEERRSFDEIAEDMMRPMLQEWLDDNLPTLVERLVREEIERVARGPRR